MFELALNFDLNWRGGSKQGVLIGTRGPAWKGGPFNMVAGTVDALAEPDSMIFEDSDGEKFGGLNLGSVREVNGRRIKVGGHAGTRRPLIRYRFRAACNAVRFQYVAHLFG